MVTYQQRRGLYEIGSRCGSTLISQLANKLPNTRSMSEPWVWARLAENYNRGWYPWAQYRVARRWRADECCIPPNRKYSQTEQISQSFLKKEYSPKP